jgi:hypothetical protein
VLIDRQFYQAGHTIDIDAIKLCPRGTANRTGTMYHGICTVNQAPEAFGVLKIPFDPPNINAGRSFMG